MPLPGTFLPERGANGGMSMHYCATDHRLKIKASPTGHECTSVWAWKRACCLNMVLHCHSKPYLAKALVMWPISLLSQRMTQYHQLSVFSSCNNFTYHIWNSFSEDQLVAASQSTQTSFVCKTLHNDTGNTFVTSTALPVRWLLHSALHGYF